MSKARLITPARIRWTIYIFIVGAMAYHVQYGIKIRRDITYWEWNPVKADQLLMLDSATVTLWEMQSLWGITPVRQFRPGTIISSSTGGKLQPSPKCVQFSPDGKSLAFGDEVGHVYMVANIDEGSVPVRLNGSGARMLRLSFSPDGQYLAVGDIAGKLMIWTLAQSAPPRVLSGAGGAIIAIAFSSDSQHVAAASEHEVVIWKTSGEQRARIPVERGEVSQLAFALDDTVLIVSATNVEYSFWTLDGRTAMPSVESEGPFDFMSVEIASIALLGENDLMACSQTGDAISIWSLKPLKRIKLIEGGQWPLEVFKASPDRESFWTLDGRGTLMRFSKDGDVLGGPFSVGGSKRSHLAISCDGKFVVAIDPDGRIDVVDSKDIRSNWGTPQESPPNE